MSDQMVLLQAPTPSAPVLPIWSQAQAQAIDTQSTATYGVPGQELMEEAGYTVYETCLALRKPFETILILAGPGNNGGDALVTARLLHAAGFVPEVWSVRAEGSSESKLRQEQRLACEAAGLILHEFRAAKDFAQLSRPLFIIDGLLGLGLSTPLRPGLYQEALKAAAQLKASQVLAIDLPSGLCADRWDQEALLPATCTVSFGAPKPLHLFAPSSYACGELRIKTLSFAPQAIGEAESQSPTLLWAPQIAAHCRPWAHLPADAHKYTRGHGLIVGGSPGKVGAIFLAAQAALRCGAGWISVAALSEQNAPARSPSLTYEDFALTGEIDAEGLEHFILQRKCKGLVLGPGTMTSPLHASLMQTLHRLNRDQGLFLIFDAAALQHWPEKARGLIFNPERTLLTPHPGEWRALDLQHQDLTSLSSLEQAWQLSERYGVTIFYKSASPFALMSREGHRRLWLTNEGDVRLARAGSGDLLAGAALALGLAGLSAPWAALAAQSLLAAAARRATRPNGVHSVLGEDILQELAV